LLCTENENKNCVYLNETLWDIEKEKVYQNYNVEEIPIVKTCTKEQIEKGECKTNTCHSDSDCLSNSCYLNSCVVTDMIYICNDILNNNGTSFECYKFNNMKCSLDNECSSIYCDSGYCSFIKGNRDIEENNSNNNNNINAITFMIFAVWFLFFCNNRFKKYAIPDDNTDPNKVNDNINTDSNKVNDNSNTNLIKTCDITNTNLKIANENTNTDLNKV